MSSSCLTGKTKVIFGQDTLWWWKMDLLWESKKKVISSREWWQPSTNKQGHSKFGRIYLLGPEHTVTVLLYSNWFIWIMYFQVVNDHRVLDGKFFQMKCILQTFYLKDYFLQSKIHYLISKSNKFKIKKKKNLIKIIFFLDGINNWVKRCQEVKGYRKQEKNIMMIE